MQNVDIQSLFQKVYRLKIIDGVPRFPETPELIFSSDSHTLIIAGGGHIVNTKTDEYDRLMKLLQMIGEKEYYLLLPTFNTDSNYRYCTISTTSTIGDLEAAIEEIFVIDFPLDSLFMFGATGEWAIYIDEGINMNLISCEQQYTQHFVDVCNVTPSDFERNISLIKAGFTNAVDFEKFVETYVKHPRNYFPH